ncbi:hypothetical protein [Convivina praedatoris]|nr:hypothetical protein [Convivina sp. LMG 32447]
MKTAAQREERIKESSAVNDELIEYNDHQYETRGARHASMKSDLQLSKLDYTKHMPWLNK